MGDCRHLLSALRIVFFSETSFSFKVSDDEKSDKEENDDDKEVQALSAPVEVDNSKF